MGLSYAANNASLYYEEYEVSGATLVYVCVHMCGVDLYVLQGLLALVLDEGPGLLQLLFFTTTIMNSTI
jgi:hypothetical protein